LTVVDVNKGLALQRLRQGLAVVAVLFLGDDLTDEDAFASLEAQDVGVKVGPGPSRARYRVRNTDDVARVLAETAELRRRATDNGQ
jgi:trehalose-6-phosphatase